MQKGRKMSIKHVDIWFGKKKKRNLLIKSVDKRALRVQYYKKA